MNAHLPASSPRRAGGGREGGAPMRNPRRLTPASRTGSFAKLHPRSSPSSRSSKRLPRRASVNAPDAGMAYSLFFDFLPPAGWRPEGFDLAAGLPTAAEAGALVATGAFAR